MYHNADAGASGVLPMARVMAMSAVMPAQKANRRTDVSTPVAPELPMDMAAMSRPNPAANMLPKICGKQVVFQCY